MGEKERLLYIKKGLRELLKEDFRQFLIDNGVADQVVIDNTTYSRLSCISGVFKYGGMYFVYSTDERSQYYDINRYEKQIDAYQDLARRFGLEYGTPTTTKKQ